MVERPPATPTGATDGVFPRRRSRRIRTLGSPKTPRTVALGRKPGKRYVSSSRRSFRIRESCQIFSRLKSYRSLVQSHFRTLSDAILPIQIPEEPNLFDGSPSTEESTYTNRKEKYPERNAYMEKRPRPKRPTKQ